MGIPCYVMFSKLKYIICMTHSGFKNTEVCLNTNHFEILVRCSQIILMNHVGLSHHPWYVVSRRNHRYPLTMDFEPLGMFYSCMNAISTAHRYFKIFPWENMCENKHTKARKYRRKQLGNGKTVISRRKSLISIVYLNLLPCMHLLKEMSFYVNCAK